MFLTIDTLLVASMSLLPCRMKKNSFSLAAFQMKTRKSALMLGVEQLR